MNHLLRILTRLYPAAWRRRYGVEFDALIEDARPGLVGALNILKGALTMQASSWTPLRVLAATTLTGILIASGITFAAPKKWSSTAMIKPTPDGQNANWADLANTVSSKVLSRRSLTEIIRTNDIYRNNLKNMVVEDVLEIFKNDIQISPASSTKGAAFQIRFIYEDKYLAQQVAMALAASFIQADPQAFQLMDAARLPVQPINPAFSAKFASVGAAGGLLIGAPIAAFLYWRRRK